MKTTKSQVRKHGHIANSPIFKNRKAMADYSRVLSLTGTVADIMKWTNSTASDRKIMETLLGRPLTGQEGTAMLEGSQATYTTQGKKFGTAHSLVEAMRTTRAQVRMLCKQKELNKAKFDLAKLAARFEDAYELDTIDDVA